jgi:hypothetical protein
VALGLAVDGSREGLEAAAPETERSSESGRVLVEPERVVVESERVVVEVVESRLDPPAAPLGALWAIAPVATAAARAETAHKVVILRIRDFLLAPQRFENPQQRIRFALRKRLKES